MTRNSSTTPTIEARSTRLAPLALLALVALVAIAGCARPPQLASEPGLVMNPSGKAPLAGLLTFTSDRPSRATLVIGDGVSSNTVTPIDAFTTEHELMVLGLRPDRLNTVEIRLESGDGLAAEPRVLEVRTGPLPDDMPPIDVRVSRPARMEPGITVVTLFQQGETPHGLLLGLDAQGEVVWYSEELMDEARRMSNGHIFGQNDAFRRRSMIETDMLGRLIKRWWATGIDSDYPPDAIPVATESFHHDVLEMPNGNLLVLSTEVRHFEDYPTSNTDPDAPRAPADIIGDVLVELRPDDGEIVREWKFLDLLDPYRVGHDFQGTNFYQGAYEGFRDPLPADWAHANGLAYEADTDSVIVSVRKMSAVIKLDLGSGELQWILGDPTGWREPWSDRLLTPIGDLEWSYGHHAPKLTPQGTLLLYDNGTWGRSFPGNPRLSPTESYSRAVEYEIDEDEMTVRQIWAYGGPQQDQFLSGFVSEADWLPQTGNVLLTNGGMIRTNEGGQGEGASQGRNWVSLMEVTHSMPAEKVWEIVIDDPSGGWVAYRSQRMPSLYPPSARF